MHDIDWSASDLFQKVRDIEVLLPRLEEFAANVASELSGTDVSPTMFRRMGGMWLMHLAHQAAGNSTNTSELRIPETLVVPADSWSHHQLFVSDSTYRSQLVAVMTTQLSKHSFSQMRLETREVAMPKQNRTRLLLEGAIQRVRRVGPLVTISQPYLKISPLDRLVAVSRSSQFMTWDDFPTLDTGVAAVNDAARFTHYCSVAGDDFESQICRAISLMMPTSYGENLARIIGRYGTHRGQPKLLYSANGSQMNLPFQVLSAIWGATGTAVLSHQHGGHQGLDEIHAGEEVEARSSDMHYSFGWTDHRPNVRPLPTALLKHRFVSSSKKLLLMSLAKSDVVYRLQPFCIPAHVRACFHETREFLDNLVWSERPTVRCSSLDLKELAAPVSVKSEGFEVPAGISMGSSALVVHNYFGVTWLESLALNIPTICFVPEGLHGFRSSAQPLVDALVHHGVIHHSGKAAARFINELKGNPASWWTKPEVQEAREAFVARYANFSDDWLNAWTTEFERLLATR